ncbi:NAD-binding protein [Actinocrinis puniceicyclus]|uniref:NAD-binding protein n=1 Tax=Actinocrinis puniceicyclus TaxID=977794 RepID=A0A8J7WN81_9ACTN|nr:RyR domain-containing protein [Actinocrinis puniceicyclus]MBS2963237.1 NAD-binding protein [Actinocrinis puniceicyclus]
MAQTRREPLSARAITTVRLFFVGLGLSSLILGYLGLGPYVRSLEAAKQLPSGDDGTSNLVYFDAELFLLQSYPLSVGGPPPGPLNFARFSAPCVAAYTLTEIGISVSAARLRRSRIRRAKGHAVVCGATRAAEVLAARLRAEGTRVVTIVPETLERPGRETLCADPRTTHALLAAGAHRAEMLYACLDRGEDNAQVAGAAEALRAGRGRPKRIHVLIPDLELCSALRARRWSLAESRTRHLGFFNPDELAAQATVRADRAAFDGITPQIAIVGTGAFARSVLVEFAWQWVARGGAQREPARVILIGDEAVETAAALCGRYAFLPRACRIEPRTEPFEHVLAARWGDPSLRPLRRLYLCQDDEGEALKAALDTAAQLHAAFAEVVVRLDRMTAMAAGFRGDRGGGVLFDALGGQLRLVDVTGEGCDPALVDDDLAEGLARACHQRYLTELLDGGAIPGSTPALVPWERLAEEYRTANRDQAADIGRKLAAIGCLLTPRRSGRPCFRWRDGELERLAELEHERWAAERLSHGWVWGAQRDDAAKRHPDLVPWDLLADRQRERDRRAVRDLPRMLADAGLAIVRIGPGDYPDP